MAGTRSGRLSLVPATREPGDVITLCRDLVVPLVLRPVFPDSDIDKTLDFKLVEE
jgi:hypothetical protein